MKENTKEKVSYGVSVTTEPKQSILPNLCLESSNESVKHTGLTARAAAGHVVSSEVEEEFRSKGEMCPMYQVPSSLCKEGNGDGSLKKNESEKNNKAYEHDFVTQLSLRKTEDQYCFQTLQGLQEIEKCAVKPVNYVQELKNKLYSHNTIGSESSSLFHISPSKRACGIVSKRTLDDLIHLHHKRGPLHGFKVDRQIPSVLDNVAKNTFLEQKNSPPPIDLECNNSNDTRACQNATGAPHSKVITGKTVRVQGDGRCLFRSLITCLSPELQITRRDEFGSPLRKEEASFETHMADALRSRVVKLMLDNAHFYGQLDQTVLNADRPILAGYSHFRERLSDMTLTSTMPGDLELNATSTALERQVLVLDANLRPIVVYGKEKYPQSEVVAVRYTRLGPDVGHYDAVIPDCVPSDILDLGTTQDRSKKDNTNDDCQPYLLDCFKDLLLKSKNNSNDQTEYPSDSIDHKSIQVPSSQNVSFLSKTGETHVQNPMSLQEEEKESDTDVVTTDKNESQISVNTATTSVTEIETCNEWKDRLSNEAFFDTSKNYSCVRKTKDIEKLLEWEKCNFFLTRKGIYEMLRNDKIQLMNSLHNQSRKETNNKRNSCLCKRCYTAPSRMKRNIFCEEPSAGKKRKVVRKRSVSRKSKRRKIKTGRKIETRFQDKTKQNEHDNESKPLKANTFECGHSSNTKQPGESMLNPGNLLDSSLSGGGWCCYLCNNNNSNRTERAMLLLCTLCGRVAHTHCLIRGHLAHTEDYFLCTSCSST